MTFIKFYMYFVLRSGSNISMKIRAVLVDLSLSGMSSVDICYNFSRWNKQLINMRLYFSVFLKLLTILAPSSIFSTALYMWMTNLLKFYLDAIFSLSLGTLIDKLYPSSKKEVDTLKYWTQNYYSPIKIANIFCSWILFSLSPFDLRSLALSTNRKGLMIL